jgi:hypothetical protein
MMLIRELIDSKICIIKILSNPKSHLLFIAIRMAYNGPTGASRPVDTPSNRQLKYTGIWFYKQKITFLCLKKAKLVTQLRCWVCRNFTIQNRTSSPSCSSKAHNLQTQTRPDKTSWSAKCLLTLTHQSYHTTTSE